MDKLEALYEKGFDNSCTLGGKGHMRIACSQCEATVVDGMPTHEKGCPKRANRTESRREFKGGAEGRFEVWVNGQLWCHTDNDDDEFKLMIAVNRLKNTNAVRE